METQGRGEIGERQPCYDVVGFRFDVAIVGGFYSEVALRNEKKRHSALGCGGLRFIMFVSSIQTLL